MPWWLPLRPSYIEHSWWLSSGSNNTLRYLGQALRNHVHLLLYSASGSAQLSKGESVLQGCAGFVIFVSSQPVGDWRPHCRVTECPHQKPRQPTQASSVISNIAGTLHCTCTYLHGKASSYTVDRRLQVVSLPSGVGIDVGCIAKRHVFQTVTYSSSSPLISIVSSPASFSVKILSTTACA